MTTGSSPTASLVLVVPSRAAAIEWPRRLAVAAGPQAAIYAVKPLELAHAVAEAGLLGGGLRPFGPAHAVHLVGRLLDADDLRGWAPATLTPVRAFAAPLARTLGALRAAGVTPADLQRFARHPDRPDAERKRLATVALLYERYVASLDGQFADPVAVLRAAIAEVPRCVWLTAAEVVIFQDMDLEPFEEEFLQAVARACPTRVIAEGPNPGAGLHVRAIVLGGTPRVRLSESPLHPLARPVRSGALARLGTALFAPPIGTAVSDGSVSLLTGPGEAAEVRAIVRRILGAARDGMPFEEMGVILPRPETYAPLFADLLGRLGVPYRLHPSLPLRSGRAARSLLLLLRCRGLTRSAVLEFLTFAPIPFGDLLPAGVEPAPARWDRLSRDAGIVSGLHRWMMGLRAHAEAEAEAAQAETTAERRGWRLQRVSDAEQLLHVVEVLSTQLDSLTGEASWPEWSALLVSALDQWIGPERDRDAVAAVLADLASLGAFGGSVSFTDVEGVIEERLEWERVPLDPVEGGAVHVGAMNAVAGLPFRLVAIPGLVEGGFPGVLRPDPFLLDAERESLSSSVSPPRGPSTAAPASPTSTRKRAGRGVQLGLFDSPELAPRARESRTSEPPPRAAARLLTTQDRLVALRRDFHRAIGQASERLILSYPRVEARTGRERLPSLFFAAAASALEGRPLAGSELDRLVVEDDLDELPLELALDRGERDRARVRRGGAEAAMAVASGSPFFLASRMATEARWTARLTIFDGLVAPLPPDLAKRLDPTAGSATLSASRLATYTRCGFQYLLHYLLKLDAVLEPEERRRLDPLERGSLFHEVAERFLRERRDQGALLVRDDEASRARLHELAEEALQELVRGAPPRLTLLWEREKARFHQGVGAWLSREAAPARSRPAHFEVAFGLPQASAPGELHDPEPLVVELGDGRTLRLNGRIDRIDVRPDGQLVIRDYKTGRAPRKDDGSLFRGGQQLQMPFYVLAARKLLPEHPVAEAFLDYVDGGRRVSLDPQAATGESFRALLRGLADRLADGVFPQEPAACEWCDFTGVCGPRPLLERQRAIKIRDPRLQRYLRLRDLG